MMSEYGIVSLISMVGFLVLSASALASYRLEWREGLRMGLIWAALIAGATALFAFLG